jgi:ribosomal protein S18 acetylase RimI-like enzyme
MNEPIGGVLERAEAPAAAEVLARAFLDNPSSLAFLAGQSEARRLKSLTRVFRGCTETVLRHGTATAMRDGERITGVSLSFPPGRFPPPLSSYRWMAVGPLMAGPAAAVRYALADAYMHRVHLRDPHHYLFVLGVDPAMQGRGVGGALLRRLGAAADSDGVACYLETDKETSVRLYQRHGYEVTRDETKSELGGLRFWTMQRPAREA